MICEQIGINDAMKAYCLTEDEKLARSMCKAYNAFFKDKEAPKKIKITVIGTNKYRSREYERNNIDIEGKIMTVKIPPDQLEISNQTFELNCYSRSNDFTSKDLPVKKDYNGRIETPMNRVPAENILRIEYGRKTIWEKPKKL